MAKYLYATVLLIVGSALIYFLWNGAIGAKEIGTAFSRLSVRSSVHCWHSG